MVGQIATNRRGKRRLTISSSFCPIRYVDACLSPSFSGSVDRAKRARCFDRSILSTNHVPLLVRTPVNPILACSSMETQRCTRHPGVDTAGQWPPWRRRSAPNVHPYTRGISLDSRRSTSLAKMATTKAAASCCSRDAILTFKTTWVTASLCLLSLLFSLSLLSLSLANVTRPCFFFLDLLKPFNRGC